MLGISASRGKVAVGVLGLAVAWSAVGCGDQPPTSAEPIADTTGALEGEVSTISVLDSDRSSMVYLLNVPSRTQPLPLVFDRDPELVAHTPLRVWGTEENGSLHVTRYQVASIRGASGESQSALIGQASTSQKIAWVQIDINGGGINQTVADANRLIFDQNAGPLFGTKAGDKSLVQYYDENSFGMLKLSGQVETPIPFTGTACDNLGGLARDVVPKVTALGRTYDHYYLFWGSLQSCGPGWGDQGTHNRNGKNVYLNNNGTFCTATGQEIGHNFGLMHASTMKCPGSVTLANDTSTCTSSEYGNSMTVMGGGCRHLSAIEKWYSLFLGGCNGVKVNSSGTFTVFPIETACNGIQALQIPFPAGAPTRTTKTDQSNGNITLKNYFLEVRASVGMDTGIKTGVYVYVAPDMPAPASNGPRNMVLDMNPATAAYDAMTVGQTFTDPAGGVSFTLDSFDGTKASITVTVEGTGGNTCIDNSTLAGSGPDSCGASAPDGGGGGTTTGTTGTIGSTTGTTGAIATTGGGRDAGTAGRGADAATSAGSTGARDGGRATDGGGTNAGGTATAGTGGGTTSSGTGATNAGGTAGATGATGASSGGGTNGDTTTTAGGTGSASAGTGSAVSTGSASTNAGGPSGTGTAGPGGGASASTAATGAGATTATTSANGSTTVGGVTSDNGTSTGADLAPNDEPAGCACRVGQGASQHGAPSKSGIALALLGLGAVVGRRRRR